MKLRSIVVAASLCLLAGTAPAETFMSGNGYQFEVPAGWVHGGQDELNAIRDQALKNANAAVPDAIFHKSSTGSPELITVEYSQAAMPVAAGHLGDVEKALVARHLGNGAKVDGVQSKIVRLGDRDYYSIRADLSAGSSLPMRALTLITSGGGKTFTFSFVCPVTEWAGDEPAFNTVANSLKIAEAPAASGGWGDHYILRRMAQIAGGVFLAAGVLWLIRFSRKRGAKTR